MKKRIIALTALLVLAISGMCYAQEPMRERILIMTNKHDDEIAEINYYLNNGGTVTHMQAVDKDPKVVYCYVIVRYPKSVPDYVRAK